MITVGALVAPSDYPVEESDHEFAAPRADDRPHAFAIHFGAHVIRVAGDGRLTIKALPAELVIYLRTGRPHPTLGGNRGRKRAT